MTKPLILKPELLRQLLALPREQRRGCWEAISELPEAFGHPHRHQRLGIRKLHPHLFECRAGFGLRLLFRDCDLGVEIFFVGNHDQVRAFLRSGRYT